MAVRIPDAAVLQATKRRDWEGAMQSFFAGRLPISDMFAAYIRGVGMFDDFTRHTIRLKLNELAVEAGLIERSGSVIDAAARLKPEYVQIVCPDLTDSFYEVVPPHLVTSQVVLAASVNEHAGLEIPPTINMVAKMARRPPVRIDSASGCELFLHPFCYQMIWREENWFCPAASNRSLSKPALSTMITQAEIRETAHDLVIIQDRFPGGNFAHFLFDWVTRIGLICESGFIDSRRCTFLMGGTPGRFEQMVLEAVAAAFDLSDEQFLFPDRGVLLRGHGRVFWFSDQVENYLHPAQVAHPQSVALLRRIAHHLHPETDFRFKRIYLSRMDAGRRRVTNEPELFDALRAFGFEAVVLSDHPVDRQLALLASAEIIVSPHGMGLAQVSLHPATPALIELHHPSLGTDAYALLATAMGFTYGYVLGEAVGGGYDDFAVPVDAVVAGVERLAPGGPPRPVMAQANRSLVDPARPLTANPQVSAQPVTAENGVPRAPFNAADSIWCHVRADSDATPDSNVGAITHISMDEGRFYTASCWVWIPAAFNGSSIDLHIGEWPNQWQRSADLAVREQWQQISAGKTCPPGVEHCNVVLRVASPEGGRIYSTHWELETNVGCRGRAVGA
jgi:hypothetical protein